ncbi:ThiF family adenylyltransferase [Parahaliea sp. F7430]|uniref:ThiF family adenylyltransferase n=1 Tax=Sediminihaliea albiluteola TaxID=2758564 RepID=A0A7W2TVJ4_9GAMM|nr:ThiF family adenylyltransferase [Sediminihaliea albiluteola]MBA6412727.1 ThiF family adenylyltransferase [Sediminihaliea albiluteola]
MLDFDYSEAFSRNLGWVTEDEQRRLQSSRVAIAGMGGVGGSHLLTLARLGVGQFHIADMDQYELANFNRQAGATVASLGRNKLEVMAELARGVNPGLHLTEFPHGVQQSNIDKFLEGVDLYVDALDFFVLDVRRAVFAACEAKGIPAITAAPLGMGVAFLAFAPGGMSFEDYFQLEGQSPEEQAIRFLLGLSPRMLQMKYLADPERVNFAEQRGPSTAMACELCAGMAATQGLKLLLGRGRVPLAPRGLHFDAYRNRLVNTWRPGGNNNLLQRLLLAIARRKLGISA